MLARLAPFLAQAEGAVVVGAGDDATVLDLGGEQAVVSIDTVVEGRHFLRALSSWEDVGWKALAAAASDLAAMGAKPLAALVGLGRPLGSPGDLADDDIEALYRGLDAACRRWRFALAGGDTVAAGELSLAVTVIGTVEPGTAVTRGGARPGDALVVVGSLGAGAAALARHRAGLEPVAGLLDAHRRPSALLGAGRILARHGATAMIDVSDGLGADCGHLVTASRVRACIDAAALPVADGVERTAHELGVDVWDLVAGGGDDYALLAAVPREAAVAAARDAAASEQVPAAVVGEVVEPGDYLDVTLEVPAIGSRSIMGLGFEHDGGTA